MTVKASVKKSAKSAAPIKKAKAKSRLKVSTNNTNVSKSYNSGILPSPLWKGPHVDGITQSLMSKYLCCKERFRLLVIEGLREPEEFDPKLEFGNMWHLCEEHKAAGDDWLQPLQDYTRKLQIDHYEHRPEIVKWYEICRRQFPLYVKWWQANPEERKRKPVFQEQEFCLPYTLPSGRVVLLRGKWDAVDSITGQRKCLYVQENKTKGDINQIQITEELCFNLQTMTYLVALGLHQRREKVFSSQAPTKVSSCQDSPFSYNEQLDLSNIGGVRYNVVRRPLSSRQGGGNMRQRKGRKTKKGLVGAETKQEFYDRVALFIRDNPGKFFYRTTVDVVKSDITKFQREFLDPFLEEVCDWWWLISNNPDPFRPDISPTHPTPVRHYRYPFGVYNSVLEGRRGAFAEYLLTGNKNLLVKVPTLFRELEPPT